VGISLSDLTWAKVKVSSDLWICVRQTNKSLSTDNCSCSRRSSTGTNTFASRSSSIEQVRFSLSDGEDDYEPSQSNRCRSNRSVNPSRSANILSTLSSPPITIPKTNPSVRVGRMIRSKTADDSIMTSVCSGCTSTDVCRCPSPSQQSNGKSIQSKVLHQLARQSTNGKLPQVTIDCGSIDSLPPNDYDLSNSLSSSSALSIVSSDNRSTDAAPLTTIMTAHPSSSSLSSSAMTQRSAPVQMSTNSNGCTNPLSLSRQPHLSNGILNCSTSSLLVSSSPSSGFYYANPVTRLISSPSSIEVKQMRAQSRMMVKSNSFNAISKTLTVSSLPSPTISQRPKAPLPIMVQMTNTANGGTTRASSTQRTTADHLNPITNCNTQSNHSNVARLKSSKSSHNLCATSLSITSGDSIRSSAPRSPCNRCQSVLSILNPYDARLRHFAAGRVRCAVLNPCRPLLVTSVAQLASINCLRTGKCVRRVQLPQRILFLSWLSPTVLALVSTTRIYHWDLSSAQSSLPQALFPLHPRVSGNQIISYETDETGRWCVLNTVAHDSGTLHFSTNSLTVRCST
jgi:hypothetical protein